MFIIIELENCVLHEKQYFTNESKHALQIHLQKLLAGHFIYVIYLIHLTNYDTNFFSFLLSLEFRISHKSKYLTFFANQKKWKNKWRKLCVMNISVESLTIEICHCFLRYFFFFVSFSAAVALCSTPIQSLLEFMRERKLKKDHRIVCIYEFDIFHVATKNKSAHLYYFCLFTK